MRHLVYIILKCDNYLNIDYNMFNVESGEDMKKVLIIGLILLLSGCSNIDTELLKEEIKAELQEEMVFSYEDLNNHLVNVTESIKSYTVSIVVTLSDDTEIIGSGIIYEKDGNDYKILTNEHVLRYAQSISVYIPSYDTYYEANLVDSDNNIDLAIITITTLDELSVYNIKLVSYSVGEFVLAVGASTSIDYSNSVTLGIISRVEDNSIQHDAAINSGNSGGPLFNLNGDLIGINVSKITVTYNGNTPVYVEGMGFSIPIEIVNEYINNWIVNDYSQFFIWKSNWHIIY